MFITFKILMSLRLRYRPVTVFGPSIPTVTVFRPKVHTVTSPLPTVLRYLTVTLPLPTVTHRYRYPPLLIVTVPDRDQ